MLDGHLHRVAVHGECEAVGRGAEAHHHRNLALGTGLGQRALHLLVVAAEEGHAATQAFGHMLREEAVALDAVHAEPLQLLLVVEEAQAVAIGEGCCASHGEPLRSQLLHLSHLLAYGLGRKEGSLCRLATVGEVGGVATVECSVEMGLERVSAPSARGPDVAVGMMCDVLVEQLAVGGCDVLYIGDVFQPSFYFKRCGARLDESVQVAAQVQVFQREQMLLMQQLVAIGIDEVELHPAELRTLTPVGRAVETIFRGVAESAVADAEGTVHKHLQLHLRHLRVDGGHLVDGELACQHGATEALLPQPFHLLGGARIGLGGGMEAEAKGLQAVGGQAHVLDEHGVDLRIGQLAKQLKGLGQFVVVEQGVHGGIDLGIVLMGILAEGGNVGHAVAGSSTRTKEWRSDVDRVGAMVDSRHATLQVLGRCQQFQFFHHNS